MMQPEYAESLKAMEKAADAIENAEYNLKGGFIDRRQKRLKGESKSYSVGEAFYCILQKRKAN